MEIPKDGMYLLVGKDIPWKVIEEEACRVKHFTPFGHIEGGKIKGARPGFPYAVLSVESPKLPNKASIPVVHKVDFQHLWEVFEERGVGPDEEVIICYVPFFRNGPMRILSGFFPRLYIYIYPKGHLEEAYDPNSHPHDPEGWFRPIAEWKPK